MTVFLEPLNGLIALHLTNRCRTSTLWPYWMGLTAKGKTKQISGVLKLVEEDNS